MDTVLCQPSVCTPLHVTNFSIKLALVLALATSSNSSKAGFVPLLIFMTQRQVYVGSNTILSIVNM